MCIRDREEREEDTRSRASSLLEELGLKHRIDHMPYQLSGGERLRAAVARALVNRPSRGLADAPTGSHERIMGEQVADLFASLNQEHEVTLVTVTHNEALADRMGTKYELNKGKLVST